MPNNCNLNGEPVDTRLETAPEVELQGAMFTRDCEDLDTTIPKKNNQYIDDCYIPDLPEEQLKLKKNITSPISVDAPQQQIPKNLLAKLLPCCIEGRTPGPDIQLEPGDFDDSADIVSVKTVNIPNIGDLSFGISVNEEDCFCDTTCGDDDFVKVKVGTLLELESPSEAPCEASASVPFISSITFKNSKIGIKTGVMHFVNGLFCGYEDDIGENGSNGGGNGGGNNGLLIDLCNIQCGSSSSSSFSSSSGGACIREYGFTLESTAAGTTFTLLNSLYITNNGDTTYIYRRGELTEIEGESTDVVYNFEDGRLKIIGTFKWYCNLNPSNIVANVQMNYHNGLDPDKPIIVPNYPVTVYEL